MGDPNSAGRLLMKEFVRRLENQKENTDNEIQWGDVTDYRLFLMTSNDISKFTYNPSNLVASLCDIEEQMEGQTIWDQNGQAGTICARPQEFYSHDLSVIQILEEMLQSRRFKLQTMTSGASVCSVPLPPLERPGVSTSPIEPAGKLQVWFVCTCTDTALRLYDRLLPVLPVLTALSAGQSFYNGALLPIDTHIAQQWPISYVSNDTPESFNNLITVHEYPQLEDNRNLAHYITGLCNTGATSFLESELESAQLPLKLIPPDRTQRVGWIVKVQCMDVQLHDEDNAALTVFLVLLSKAIMLMDEQSSTWQMRASLISENFARAQQTNTISQARFHFRVASSGISELSVNQIVNGCPGFIGLIPIIEQFLETYALASPAILTTLQKYLGRIRQRSTGFIPTDARRWRDFVTNHIKYDFQNPKVVPKVIIRDFLSNYC